MKRIALLLAGALLGTGCVVETTCDTQSVTVDWVFHDSNGAPYFGCADAGVNYVDIYVDGYLEDSVACTDLGQVYIPNLPSDSGQVMVEGVYSNGIDPDVVLLRDWLTLDSCGETYFASSPGEETITIQPDSCLSAADYIWYRLVDTTRLPVQEVARLDGNSADPYAISCDPSAGRFSLTVPFGRYLVDWIDEVTGTGTYRYWGSCADPEFSVVDIYTPVNSVTMYTDTACFP